MSRMRTKDIFGEAGRVNSKDISEEKFTPQTAFAALPTRVLRTHTKGFII